MSVYVVNWRTYILFYNDHVEFTWTETYFNTSGCNVRVAIFGNALCMPSDTWEGIILSK